MISPVDTNRFYFWLLVSFISGAVLVHSMNGAYGLHTVEWKFGYGLIPLNHLF